MKKITVIVPVYNTAQYLRRCIESIITQAYANLEIILVDDGSADNSGAVCDEYAQKDPRIIVIHKPNGGLSSARNAALDRASGDLISFVDSDDWLGEDAYTGIVETQENTGADIVKFGYVTAFPNGTYEDWKYVFDSDKVLSKKQALNLLVQDKFIKSRVWDKVFVKKLFLEKRFPVGKNFEDVALMYKLFLQADTVAVLANHQKYFYLQRSDSIVRSIKFKNYADFFESAWARYADLKNNPLVDKQILFVSTLSVFVTIAGVFPFKYAALCEKRCKGFLSENREFKSVPLNKSHRWFLRLPFPLFVLLYNRLTRRLAGFLKRRKTWR